MQERGSIRRHLAYPLILSQLVCRLFAADAFVGTWKLNTAQSKYTAGSAPREETLIIQEKGEQTQVTIIGVGPDGLSLASSYEVPTKGGTSKAKGNLFDMVTAKRIDDTTLEVSFAKNGKAIRSVRSVLSKDGTTLTVTVLQGIDAQGKPVKGLSVFNRQ